MVCCSPYLYHVVFACMVCCSPYLYQVVSVWSAAVLTCIRCCLYGLLQSLPYQVVFSCIVCCSPYLYQVVSVWPAAVLTCIRWCLPVRSAAVLTCIRWCLYGLLQYLLVSGGVCRWPQCRTEVCCSLDPRSGTGGIRTWGHQICSSSARTRGPTVSHT